MMMMMMMMGAVDAERRLLGVSSAHCCHAWTLTRHHALVDDVRQHTEQNGDGDGDADDQADVHRYRADALHVRPRCVNSRCSRREGRRSAGTGNHTVDHLAGRQRWRMWSRGDCGGASGGGRSCC